MVNTTALMRFAAAAVAIASAGVHVTATAQTFPTRQVTMVVPFAPGGITDGVARIVATRLGEKWKQTVIVDNRPGGGTIVGTQVVAKAAPDGHTLLVTSVGFTTNPILVKNLPYDPAALSALNMIATSPNVLFVNARVPASNVSELIAMAKANPGKLTFASSGNASSTHLAAELFASITNTDIVHVPYKGTGPAMTDLIGGQVTGMFDTLTSMQHVKTGGIKALAVASKKRMPGAPDVPTFAEVGLPAMETGTWLGSFVPAATPAPIRKKVFDDIQEVLSAPDTQTKIAALGFEPTTMTQPEFVRFLDNERVRWTKVIDERHIRLD